MPLIKSSSKAAVGENIRREKAAGKPQRQAVAIALETARRNRAAGGRLNFANGGAPDGGGAPMSRPDWLKWSWDFNNQLAQSVTDAQQQAAAIRPNLVGIPFPYNTIIGGGQQHPSAGGAPMGGGMGGGPGGPLQASTTGDWGGPGQFNSPLEAAMAARGLKPGGSYPVTQPTVGLAGTEYANLGMAGGLPPSAGPAGIAGGSPSGDWGGPGQLSSPLEAAMAAQGLPSAAGGAMAGAGSAGLVPAASAPAASPSMSIDDLMASLAGAGGGAAKAAPEPTRGGFDAGGTVSQWQQNNGSSPQMQNQPQSQPGGMQQPHSFSGWGTRQGTGGTGAGWSGQQQAPQPSTTQAFQDSPQNTQTSAPAPTDSSGDATQTSQTSNGNWNGQTSYSPPAAPSNGTWNGQTSYSPPAASSDGDWGGPGQYSSPLEAAIAARQSAAATPAPAAPSSADWGSPGQFSSPLEAAMSAQGLPAGGSYPVTQPTVGLAGTEYAGLGIAGGSPPAASGGTAAGSPSGDWGGPGQYSSPLEAAIAAHAGAGGTSAGGFDQGGTVSQWQQNVTPNGGSGSQIQNQPQSQPGGMNNQPQSQPSGTGAPAQQPTSSAGWGGQGLPGILAGWGAQGVPSMSQLPGILANWGGGQGQGGQGGQQQTPQPATQNFQNAPQNTQTPSGSAAGATQVPGGPGQAAAPPLRAGYASSGAFDGRASMNPGNPASSDDNDDNTPYGPPMPHPTYPSSLPTGTVVPWGSAEAHRIQLSNGSPEYIANDGYAPNGTGYAFYNGNPMTGQLWSSPEVETPAATPAAPAPVAPSGGTFLQKYGGRLPYAAGGRQSGWAKWRLTHPNSAKAGGGEKHFSGAIKSPVPGRTDKIPLTVKGGSYVLPAEHVSHLGQGNSASGHAIIDKMFTVPKSAPYGVSAPKPPGGMLKPHPFKAQKFADGGAPYDPDSGVVAPQQFDKGDPRYDKRSPSYSNKAFRDAQLWYPGPQFPTLNNQAFSRAAEGFPESTNIEDRRGDPPMSDEQAQALRNRANGVNIMAAGGEHVLTPEQIIARLGDLDKGHDMLDQWVQHEKKNQIKVLRKLPAPRKD